MRPPRLIALLLITLAAWLPSPAQQVPDNQLTKDAILARLQRYATTNSERMAILSAMFEEAGCQGVDLRQQKVFRSKLPNVICTLPGESEEVIVVGAHFDCICEGEGVVDNWSGAALLPSLYQALKPCPRRRTFVFIGFTDEEKGLLGSEFYARGLSRQQRAKIRAMINLDSLGLSPTKVWSNRADRELEEILGGVAKSLGLPVHGVNVEGVGTSDSESFRTKKIPSMTIHSVTQETLEVLHTRRDQFRAIQSDAYYDTYQLISAFLATLDRSPPR